MNNKGFMMAEVIVVSSIILVFLAGLYLSYNKIFAAYNSRIDYYDASTLYRLAYYRDNLIEEDKMNDALSSANNNTIIEITNFEVDSNYNDKVFLIYNNKSNIASSILGSKTVNATFKDYASFLSTSANLTGTNYVMIMERCKKSDNNDCKYAYLEVLDGYE